jgi:hypothetical protein
VVQRRHQQQAEKSDRGKERDDFLTGLPLPYRPAGQASLQQRRIVLGEISRYGRGRAAKDREKQPALPLTHRAGGGKQQHRHHQGEQEISEPGFYVQTDHDL